MGCSAWFQLQQSACSPVSLNRRIQVKAIVLEDFHLSWYLAFGLYLDWRPARLYLSQYSPPGGSGSSAGAVPILPVRHLQCSEMACLSHPRPQDVVWPCNASEVAWEQLLPFFFLQGCPSHCLWKWRWATQCAPTWAASRRRGARSIVPVLLCDCILSRKSKQSGRMFFWPAVCWQSYCSCDQQ